MVMMAGTTWNLGKLYKIKKKKYLRDFSNLFLKKLETKNICFEDLVTKCTSSSKLED